MAVAARLGGRARGERGTAAHLVWGTQARNVLRFAMANVAGLLALPRRCRRSTRVSGGSP